MGAGRPGAQRVTRLCASGPAYRPPLGATCACASRARRVGTVIVFAALYYQGFSKKEGGKGGKGAAPDGADKVRRGSAAP